MTSGGHHDRSSEPVATAVRQTAPASARAISSHCTAAATDHQPGRSGTPGRARRTAPSSAAGSPSPPRRAASRTALAHGAGSPRAASAARPRTASSTTGRDDVAGADDAEAAEAAEAADERGAAEEERGEAGRPARTSAGRVSGRATGRLAGRSPRMSRSLVLRTGEPVDFGVKREQPATAGRSPTSRLHGVPHAVPGGTSPVLFRRLTRPGRAHRVREPVDELLARRIGEPGAALADVERLEPARRAVHVGREPPPRSGALADDLGQHGAQVRHALPGECGGGEHDGPGLAVLADREPVLVEQPPQVVEDQVGRVPRRDGPPG